MNNNVAVLAKTLKLSQGLWGNQEGGDFITNQEQLLLLQIIIRNEYPLISELYTIITIKCFLEWNFQQSYCSINIVFMIQRLNTDDHDVA